MKEQIEKILNQYDIAMLFATKKEGHIDTIKRELDLKNKLIDSIRDLVKNPKQEFDLTKIIQDAVERTQKSIEQSQPIPKDY
jgi:predicted ATP-grasp superfamily ATP-dependent carboligase